jgi:hypothetical protein
MNDRPTNPWHDATVEPTEFPILYRTRSGHFHVMNEWLDETGRPWWNWENVTHWKSIELPTEVSGKEACTLNRLDRERPGPHKRPGRPLRRLEGQRFGRLTVLSRSAHQPHHNACWTCRCDCGKTVRVTGNNLVRVVTRSCGCLRQEHMQRVGFANATTH